MSRTTRALAITVSCAGLLLAGCSASFSVGGASVDKADLEKGVSDMLTKQVGQKPDSVTCPGPLKAEVGQSERCELTAGGDRIGLTVTITSYENDNAKYDIKVDDKPMD